MSFSIYSHTNEKNSKYDSRLIEPASLIFSSGIPVTKFPQGDIAGWKFLATIG